MHIHQATCSAFAAHRCYSHHHSWPTRIKAFFSLISWQMFVVWTTDTDGLPDTSSVSSILGCARAHVIGFATVFPFAFCVVICWHQAFESHYVSSAVKCARVTTLFQLEFVHCLKAILSVLHKFTPISLGLCCLGFYSLLFFTLRGCVLFTLPQLLRSLSCKCLNLIILLLAPPATTTVETSSILLGAIDCYNAKRDWQPRQSSTIQATNINIICFWQDGRHQRRHNWKSKWCSKRNRLIISDGERRY